MTTYRRAHSRIGLALIALAFSLLACNLQAANPQLQRQALPDVTSSASETIPPFTPLPSLTPSRTLKPPPTFEPPTQTPIPSRTPSVTPTSLLDLDVSIPGLHGAETPTPSTTPGCKKRDDWKLRYTVQPNDALARIAGHFQTNVAALVAANCLTDANLIRVGQELRVPGDSLPVQPAVECVPFELLTPMNGTLAVEGDGAITFNWRGPRAPRNLIRIHRPDGSLFEDVVELRQNESIDLYENLHAAGTYTWYVYPLDANFVQVCPEGGPWTFAKAESATATPKPTKTKAPPDSRPTPIIVTATPAPTEDNSTPESAP